MYQSIIEIDLLRGYYPCATLAYFVKVKIVQSQIVDVHRLNIFKTKQFPNKCYATISKVLIVEYILIFFVRNQKLIA